MKAASGDDEEYHWRVFMHAVYSFFRSLVETDALSME